MGVSLDGVFLSLFFTREVEISYAMTSVSILLFSAGADEVVVVVVVVFV